MRCCLDAPLIVTGGAVLAQVMSATFDPIVDEDTVADLKIGTGIGADLHHLAGQVAAQDVRKPAAVAGAQVQV